MTTKEIQILTGKMQVLKFHSPVCENISCGSFEMDVMSISKSGMMYEFEVKISRSDFRADQKKEKKIYYLNPIISGPRVPNYFSYVCPDGLISPDELEPYAGLYYCRQGDIVEVKKPKRIHPGAHNEIKIMEKVCRVYSERQFLGSCRMTYQNNESKRVFDENKSL